MRKTIPFGLGTEVFPRFPRIFPFPAEARRPKKLLFGRFFCSAKKIELFLKKVLDKSEKKNIIIVTVIVIEVLPMTHSKYSRQRETLIGILRGTTCHPNADWIYDKAREEIPNISLGTVYRNLSKLAGEGKILKLDVGDGSDHYDGDISPHAHFYCKRCRRICDIFVDYGRRLKDEAREQTGGIVERCDVMFEGTCRECLRYDEETPAP